MENGAEREQSGKRSGAWRLERAWQKTIERERSAEREVAERERSGERGLQK